MSVVGAPRTINVIDNPDVECKCVSDHNPNAVQLHVHHIFPLGWGGEDVETNELLLCPTTHDAVHRLLREYMKADGEPAWGIRKFFGTYARNVAEQGWNEYQSRLAAMP